MQRVPAVIIDGKWCIQMPVCNARNLGLQWLQTLAVGFLAGCTRRPVPGSRYCDVHLPECTCAPEEADIVAHRVVNTGDTIVLEYRVSDSWVRGPDLSGALLLPTMTCTREWGLGTV